MTTSNRMSTINVVLKELQITMQNIEQAEIQFKNKERAAKRAATIQSDAAMRLYHLQQQRDRLKEAADVLNKDDYGGIGSSNWREWPWVVEAGFAKEL